MLPEQFPYCFTQGIMNKKQAGGSGGFLSNFRTVFGKELHGKMILRTHGVGQKMCGKRQPLDWAGLGLGSARLGSGRNRRPEAPEASGAISVLFLVRNCKETGGRAVRRLPEYFPCCF